MARNYRPVVVLTATGLLGTLCLWQGAAPAQNVKKAPPLVAQRVPPAAPAKRAAALAPPGAPKKADADSGQDQFAEGLTLPTDRRKRLALQAARDYIDQEQFDKAIEVLENLLTVSKEDVFVEIKHKEKGRTVTEPRSLFHEADRLIGSLPADALDSYELQYGGRAKALLEQARKRGDRKLLAEVALKYHHTAAGAEAANLLGTLYLDRGDYVTADRSFDSLLHHRHADKLSAMTLLKAALAFRRAGDTGNYDKVWPMLRRKIAGEGLAVGDEALSLEQIQALLNRARSTDLTRADREVPMFGGSPNRCTQYVGGDPYLDDVKWTRTTIYAPKDPDNTDLDPSRTRDWVSQAVQSQENLSQPVLPGFFPIAATVQTDEGPIPLLVYRSYWGVHAVDLRTGELEWESPLSHSLEHLLGNPKTLATIQQWWANYANGSGQVLYENSVLGTLSTDGNRVYLVDDIALPPHPTYMNGFMWQQRPSLGTELDRALQSNQLQAFDLESGKLVWALGGMEADKNDLQQSYFLGPPLPLGGKLYVLNEKKSELRLLCLDPVNGGAVVWSQVLANMKDSLEKDVGRRMHAAHLAYGEGILVCPTNAGAILAIDLLTHSLVWAKAYKEPPPATMQNGRRMGMVVNTQTSPLSSDWKDSVPIVQDGRVVFTAPDGSGVMCLDLRTGNKVWSTSRQADDLYLAGVYGGKVLIVGKSRCRALNLADGNKVWQQPTLTGLPSGEGVAANNVYYLPLRHGAHSKLPEVCRIDINTGQILGSSKARLRPGNEDKPEIPGNLLFFGDDVISQTVTDIKAYPQVDAKIKLITARLTKNPKDPVGLTERGEMHLDKGQWQAAADDLHLALANHPPAEVLPKTQAKLFEALTELLNRDFSRNEPYLDEYEKLSEVGIPATASPEEKLKLQEEHRQRLATFLALKAKGRETQGRLVEAFDAYRKFGTLSGNRELIPSVDDASIQVRPDLWAQERIANMLGKATPDQRRPLESRIAMEWQKVRNADDTAALRRFVAVFGVRSIFGQEAMLRLGERLMHDPKDALEAELLLLQLRTEAAPPLAARAVEALAHGMLGRNLMDDAAYYYRLLDRQFGDVVVRDGKTGADLYNELATDKRFWPYLDEPRQPWVGKRLKAKAEWGNYPMTSAQQQSFSFTPEGDVLPYFQRSRLEMFNNSTLRLVDRYTGANRFKVTGLNALGIGYLYNGATNARLPYEVEGHLLVFNHGHMVYGFDALSGTKLWQKNLFGSGNPNLQHGFGTSVDKDGTVEILIGTGFRMRLGRTGPVEPSYVCLQTRRALIAFDPITGATLWSRTGLAPNARLFGDADHVYLIETQPNGSMSSAQVFRARDGVVLKDVPDFLSAYEHRLSILGGRILVNDTDSDNRLVVRLYDIPTGKDLWKRTYSTGAKIIHCENPDLVGVVEPNHDGRVTVFNIHTAKNAFVTRLPTKDLDKVPEGGFRLVDDDDQFYLTVNKPPENNRFGGGTWSALQGNIRTVPVDGRVYAYHRDTGKLHWIAEVNDQMLIVDRFNEMPILLFASRSNRMQGKGGMRRWVNKVEVVSVEKRTGKILYEPRNENSNLNNQNFYALNIDPKNGTVDLVSYGMRLHHYIDTTPIKNKRAHAHVRTTARANDE